MIKQETLHFVMCDCCNDMLDYDGIRLGYPTEEEAIRIAEDSGWYIVDGQMFCEHCWHRDENDHIAIANGRVYDEENEKWIK